MMAIKSSAVPVYKDDKFVKSERVWLENGDIFTIVAGPIEDRPAQRNSQRYFVVYCSKLSYIGLVPVMDLRLKEFYFVFPAH